MPDQKTYRKCMYVKMIILLEFDGYTFHPIRASKKFIDSNIKYQVLSSDGATKITENMLKGIIP